MVERDGRSALVRRLVPAAVLAVGVACSGSARAQSPASSSAVAAASRPATVWSWLGIPQGVHRVRDAVVNRCGLLPGLERKPPLLRIADPALAEIDNAAIKKAQQIKAEEDLAPQKIKAIKYLATLGCEKCYGGVEEAMLESLKDCTEKVRFETIKALASIPNEKCPQCDNDCCSEKIVEQLAKMAYERDPSDPDCWLEPSARVRRAAMEMLGACCCDQTAPPDAMSPTERPTEPPPVEGGDRGVPIESSASRREPLASPFRRDYHTTMAIHVAPRRSCCTDEPPDPSGQRSVLVRSVVVDQVHAAAGSGAGGQGSGQTFLDDRVQAAAYVAPLPPVAARAARVATSRQAAASPTLTNTYGRRYVTWGVPLGDYRPPVRPQPQPTIRRGILD